MITGPVEINSTMSNNSFMLRAVQLAEYGLGAVSPNPLVGCVIVRGGMIIGEGWHREFGGPHAEVNAIRQVDKQEWLKESEMYVTLEPCSHIGKTPPCTGLIIQKEIRKVYIANLDPNPVVNGSGIKALENAGISVFTGMEDVAAGKMNRRYLTALKLHRPYFILKWAQTLDGFIAHENHDSKWISNGLSRQLVHQWRAQEDAVLAGFNTVLYDNPRLNVRDWKGKNPARIILDPELKLPPGLNVFDHSQSTFIFNGTMEKSEENLKYMKINRSHLLQEVSGRLVHQGIHSVLVEGGGATINEFINHGFWDEARVFVSDKIFNRGIPAPKLIGQTLTDQTGVTGDTLYIYMNQKPESIG